MNNNIFSPMEMDAIGEIMNISLGSSATAVSNLLDHRVDITTPRVQVIEARDLILGDLDPAVGVEIRYVSGLEGSNIMLLKRDDVKTIVDILMGSETPEEEFELNELTISAVCEVMNQMMGAASTALSDFLGQMVNISTPQSFELNDFNQFKQEHFPDELGNLVVVHFILTIEGFMRSEFINVISVELARELIAGFGLDTVDDISPSPAPTAEAPASSSGGTLSQDEIERLMAGGAAEPPPPSTGGASLSQAEIERLMAGDTAAPPQAAASSGGTLSQEEIERLMSAGTAASAPPPAAAPAATMSQVEIERLMAGGAATASAPISPPIQTAPPNPAQPPYPYPQVPYPPQPSADYPMPAYYPPLGYYYPQQPISEAPPQKLIQTQAVQLSPLDPETQLNEEQAKNLDLIMSVPLEVSVEIGRTQRKVQDILAFSKGSLVVLDKLAGDQVDLFVNGFCIAKGDVVVIDDNFGIRITEVLSTPAPSDMFPAR